jgi:hypothetical protein
VVKGECFALNYHLSERSQCDFVTGGGVCPDYAGSGAASGNTSASLLACDMAGDALSVLLRRPLGDSDGKANAWPTDGSRFSIFAMGPVSEGSTAARPVVLIHTLRLPGASAPAAVHTLPGQRFRVDLAGGRAAGQASCTRFAPTTGPPAPAPPAPPAVQVATVQGVSVFDVTLAKSPNYPNPPGWGVSYWINGAESPVLVVERWVEYTFVVAAGPTHPLYITTSVIGGGALDDYANQTVFAGGDADAGAPGDAAVVRWTPDAATPDVVYYQCAVHQKIGWKIRVVDPPAATALGGASPPAPLPALVAAPLAPSAAAGAVGGAKIAVAAAALAALLA